MGRVILSSLLLLGGMASGGGRTFLSFVYFGPGLTNRALNEDYSKALKLDPRVTVQIHASFGTCTGTFLNSSTLITAAHCTDLEAPTGGISVGGVLSLNVFIHPEVKGLPITDASKWAPYDVALLVFPEGTAEYMGAKTYPGVATKQITPGKEVTLVGYGDDDFYHVDKGISGKNAGIKGWGKTTVTGYSNENGVMVTLGGPKEGTIKTSAMLIGDSGASAHGDRGEVIGILSSYGPFNGSWEKTEQVLNVFVDTTTDRTKSLFKRAILCEEPPCAENFNGSSIPNDVAKAHGGTAKAMGHVLNKRTPKIMEGRYRDSQDSNTEIYVSTRYLGESLILVNIHPLKEGKLEGTSEQYFIFEAEGISFDNQVKSLTWEGNTLTLGELSREMRTFIPADSQ